MGLELTHVLRFLNGFGAGLDKLVGYFRFVKYLMVVKIMLEIIRTM